MKFDEVLVDPRRRDVLRLATLATVAGCTHTSPEPSLPESESERVPMQTRPLMTLRLHTAPTQETGKGPYGERVTFPIVGGTFEGERLRGEVLAGGDDWTIRRDDGVLELDLRVTLKTHDGALIHMTFEGIRDDDREDGPYFRTLPRFETADPKYAFLNRLLAAGTGEIRDGAPVHVIEELL